MKVSKYFSLSEFTDSAIAKRLGINNNPTPEHLENIKFLSINVLDKIREYFNTVIYLSSGYRSSILNSAVKGSSKTSQHSLGEAADIDMDGSNKVTNKMVFEYIRDNLDFDQLINEFDYSWVHVSLKRKGKNRKQVLKAVKNKAGKTVYIVI
jgi:zinc D-Ala-D-Ala carboxypeptidase